MDEKIENPARASKGSELSITQFNPQQDIERAKQAATALMQVIEATKPLKMAGKIYLYFEHWQTIARFFNATVGIEWTKEIRMPSAPENKGYEAKSIVYQQGIIIGGAEASCLRDEPNWKGKPDFQLRSMAQTRAMAKGLRSIFGYIAVLAGVEATPAEELEGHQKPNPAITGEKTPKPITDKQKGMIKALMSEKGVLALSQIGIEPIEKPTVEDASMIIKKLMDYKVGENIIQVDV